jgi:phosphoglycolate phosphatase-like HAD superfamily hydrolase
MRKEEGLVSALEAWLAIEPAPARGRLELAIASRAVDPILMKALIWSIAVDESMAELPPPRTFRGAEAALQLFGNAELVVLTAGPAASAAREWQEAGIMQHLSSISGQERGPKGANLIATMAGRYAPEHVLVIGDSPGDLEAARSAGASFYPILPGREEESWSSFASSYLPAFIAGASPSAPVAAFFEALPSSPPWLG